MHDMKRRFALYGFGFAMGILMVFFFLGGKDASCNWMPNSRMLKIIREKKINYSDSVKNTLITTNIDSLDINEILTHGNIDFSKSQTKNKPCRAYIINGEKKQVTLQLLVKVCDSTAIIESLIKK